MGFHGISLPGGHLLVDTLKTQIFSVTANAQNTLQHLQGAVSPLLLPAGAHGCNSSLLYTGAAEDDAERLFRT